MSYPWLNKGRSSSRSPKRQRVDQFGRTVKSRSRSRSRDRSRSRSRDERPRRRRRSGSSSSDSSNSSTQTRIIASMKPKYLNARLFVANIVSKDITKDEIIRHFEKYGNVVDVLIHHKNYCFVQYLKEEEARLAVEGEHGSSLNGWKLDVKMSNENRAGTSGFNRGRGGGGGGGGRGDKGRPDRDHGGRRERGGRGGRDRSPPRGMGPYDDPYGPPRPYPPPLMPPEEFDMRDPYLPPDPYRRGPGFPDPWLPPPPGDPYRYGDPFRDPYGPPPPRAPPPPIECEVFIVSAKLRAYGEAVEMRVKDQSVITGLSVIPEGRTAPQMVEDVTSKGGLFAIFINPQNEEHRSVTLNILHGSPQEHRNMPLDDAISLVGRSFTKYVEGLREKANAASTPATAPPTRVFLQPTQDQAYLLNLLADNRALTVPEIDTVIKYLKERRDKLVDAESRPLITDDGYLKSPASFAKSPSQPSEAGSSGLSAKERMELTQRELTNKILSIFNSAGGTIKGVPPASSTASSQNNAAPPLPQASSAPPPPPPPPPSSSGGVTAASTSSPAAGGASLINFDNPNVQAALDNLIQTSPNLLKNISPNGKGSSGSRSGRDRNEMSGMGPGDMQGMGPDMSGMGPGMPGMGPGMPGMGPDMQGGYMGSYGPPMGGGYGPPHGGPPMY